MNKKFSDAQIQDFWQQHARFLHANLVSEAPNPTTADLSQLCQNDLPAAFKLFQQIELDAILAMLQYTDKIVQLQSAVKNCIIQDGYIYLVGCGASGRLAMLLKRLWELYNPNAVKRIICVSSAGDTSLIKAVEQFEDKTEFGIQQLLQQGYTANDLVIGLSASGESPFIMAAVMHAANTSLHKPWLIFNNPITSLLERNPQHIVTNHKVQSMALDVGAMALTGSTRLQATSAMQIAVSLALCSTDTDISTQIKQIHSEIKAIPLEQLSPITIREAQLFAKKDFILYQTDNALIGLSLLADITERAPTFNLIPFENINDQHPKYSPFYLSLNNAATVDDAWQVLLGQAPVCLEWDNFTATSRHYINGFDLSSNSLRKTGSYLPNPQHSETWLPREQILSIYLDELSLELPLPVDLLHKTLAYKLYLNSHSTLMMGRLAYFEGNMMLSLKPSNFKLIDRAIRYSQFILREKYKHEIEYMELAKIVFAEIEKLEPNQSIVTNVINQINVTPAS